MLHDYTSRLFKFVINRAIFVESQETTDKYVKWWKCLHFIIMTIHRETCISSQVFAERYIKDYLKLKSLLLIHHNSFLNAGQTLAISLLAAAHHSLFPFSPSSWSGFGTLFDDLTPSFCNCCQYLLVSIEMIFLIFCIVSGTYHANAGSFAILFLTACLPPSQNATLLNLLGACSWLHHFSVNTKAAIRCIILLACWYWIPHKLHKTCDNTI